MKAEKLIEQRRNTEQYTYFKYGEDYYNHDNTAIMNREKRIVLEKYGEVRNPFMANHTIPSGFFPLLVDQKVMYLLGNGVTFAEEQDLSEYFKINFDEIMRKLALTASKKGEAWLYAYMDAGRLMFTDVPAEQLTPVYDTAGNLSSMIRRYDEDDESIMLIYDDQTVQKWVKRKTDREYQIVGTYGHYQTIEMFNGKKESEEDHGFGMVPFIGLFNNDQHVSDLKATKKYIDTYDIINSDFANNIDDMQDAYFVLKGYSGDMDNLTDFMHQLKQIKAVPVAEDGDLQSHQLQIPTEARTVFLDRLTKDIFRFGMGVDTDAIASGNVTNVMIMAMYGNLDLKCDLFESQVREFMTRLVTFINNTEGTAYTDDFSLDRSLIMNKSERIEDLQRLAGLISRRTMWEKLPLDIDPDEEERRMEAEAGGDLISLQDTDGDDM